MERNIHNFRHSMGGALKLKVFSECAIMSLY